MEDIKGFINDILNNYFGESTITFHPISKISPLIQSKFPRESMKDIEERLIEKIGLSPDIHSVYTIDSDIGTIYLWFSEAKVYCGMHFKS